jgi:hypothetical protein
MEFKWRKWNRAIHRDFGYLFFGMTLIYALSGIAINHRSDWNPNYIIVDKEITGKAFDHKLNKDEVVDLLQAFGEEDSYRKHYYPSPGVLKVYLTGGMMMLDTETGEGYIETTRRRPMFREMNYLHYNPSKYWTWFSDIFAGALVILALSGILIPRGADGISARGAWITLLGVLIPVLFIIYYLY